MNIRENGDQLYTDLDKIAQGVASDISAAYPELSVAYDLYAEELGRWQFGGKDWPFGGADYGLTIGVIDMGEAYQGVYIWKLEDKWEQDFSYDFNEAMASIRKKRSS